MYPQITQRTQIGKASTDGADSTDSKGIPQMTQIAHIQKASADDADSADSKGIRR
jgi:hypothetical protein